MEHEEPEYAKAIGRIALSASMIAEWSKTLPDEHREAFVKLCRTLPTAICFCGCHISYVGD
jgi:hypothetical protein